MRGSGVLVLRVFQGEAARSRRSEETREWVLEAMASQDEAARIQPSPQDWGPEGRLIACTKNTRTLVYRMSKE
jgi:hypothetical protein